MQSQRTLVGILALVLPFLGLGWIGVHKFIMGYTKEGFICLGVTLVTCGLAGIVFSIISIVEGIIYLTMTDDRFESEYVINKKPWF